MTQFDGQTEQQILRDILQVIAKYPDPNHSISSLLQTTLHITGAGGAYYLLFHEPHLFLSHQIVPEQFPDDEALESFTLNLDTDVYTGADVPEPLADVYRWWSVLPISIQDSKAAALCLFFSEQTSLNEDAVSLLGAVVDGLAIITTNARRQAKHERLNHNRNEFIRQVTHDLRSPLTSTQGFATMLQSNMVGELNEKQARFVSKIISGIDQLSALVDNIQDAGRYDPETGSYQMERSACDLIDVVQEIVEQLTIPTDKQNLKISVVAGDDVPIINIDTTMFRRALLNLIDNAVKYTPDGGKIEVGLRREQDHLIVSVKDDGFGISSEDQKRIFERHYRAARREHRRVKGSGLGLFIVKSVAQQHGGKVYVESEDGQGSTFFMAIPLTGQNLLGGDAVAGHAP